MNVWAKTRWEHWTTLPYRKCFSLVINNSRNGKFSNFPHKYLSDWTPKHQMQTNVFSLNGPLCRPLGYSATRKEVQSFSNGHSWPFFFIFCLLYKQLNVFNIPINVTDDWILTRVLWYQKQPRCQLCHKCHSPSVYIFSIPKQWVCQILYPPSKR